MNISDEMRSLEKNWGSTQKRLESDYNTSMGKITQQADAKRGTIQKNYETDYGLAQSRKNDADTQTNQTTNKALGDAYVGKMLNARNINQQLAAMGRSGGAAESTLLGLQNNYQTNRAGLESERAKALAEILAAFNEQAAALDKTRSTDLLGVDEWQAAQEQSARNTYQQLLEQARAAYNSERNQLLAIKAQQAAAAAAAAAQSARSSGGSSQPAEKGYDNGMLRSWANMNNTMSNQQIYNELKRQGYSDAAIAKAADFFAPTGE